MRFLIDAQLPQALCQRLEQAGYQVRHVKEALSKDAADADIWAWALANSYVIVTKDEDFVRRLQSGAIGPAVVWIRIGNCTNQALWALLGPIWPAICAAMQAGERIVEVQ